MRIPDWLSHLRIDERGRPVPYVNRWGPESTARLAIRHDPWCGMPGLFDDDQDEAVPDFKAQNMGRQREVVARGLCQVCARPVPWSRRFLVVSSISVEWVRVEALGRTVPVVTEPWLDERCAEFAMAKCPGLIRRDRDDDLRLVAVNRQRDAMLIVSSGWTQGHLEEKSRRVLPAMWAKIALTNLHIRRSLSLRPPGSLSSRS